MLDIEITLAAEAGRQRYEERMQMVQQVTKYVASDGQIFDTERAADDYELEIEFRLMAATFASQHDDDDMAPTARTIKRRENLIVAWELWRREREAQANG